jgi:Zn-dependent protease with chaperone function
VVNVQFSQIHPRAFAHPYDRRATAAFESVPLFPDLLTKITQFSIEERFRAHHMLNSVQIGPNQFPSLWRIVNEVAERLAIPAPNAYLTRSGGINAFAFGRHSHSIVLTTALVDMMSDREIEGIIAHELGHILCEHMLYMGVGLTLTSGALPSLGLSKLMLPVVEDALSRAFFAWFRAAEYSADRAAVLILDDPNPLAECLCRLAGVPKRLEKEFDLLLFTDQARAYEQESTWWSKVVTFGMDAFLTHPEPAKRTTAILEWAASDEYKAIRSGSYLTKFEVEAQERIQIEGVRSCPLCRNPVGPEPVCSSCGLDQNPGRQRLCPREHVNGIDWMFCKACGARLISAAKYSEIPGY